MLGKKILLLLPLICMVNAQYRRIPPRPLPDRPMVIDDMENKAAPPPSLAGKSPSVPATKPQGADANSETSKPNTETTKAASESKPPSYSEKKRDEIKSESEYGPRTGDKDKREATPATESETNTKTESQPNMTTSNEDDHSIGPTGMICKAKNAYYRFPYTCDSFIECQKYVATKRVCPDGLLFNRKAIWPTFPCSFPSEVKCRYLFNWTTNDTYIYDRTGKCPRRFGSFATRENDCERYIVCDEGRAIPMTCPRGLAFNPKISACDWPQNVPNCNPRVFKNFVCPMPSVDSKGNLSEKTYHYRYQNSCKQYIACYKGQPRLLECDAGLYFDEKTSRCIDANAVVECK